MRKTLWTVLAVLCVAIGVPNAKADSYNIGFTVIDSSSTFAPTPSFGLATVSLINGESVLQFDLTPDIGASTVHETLLIANLTDPVVLCEGDPNVQGCNSGVIVLYQIYSGTVANDIYYNFDGYSLGILSFTPVTVPPPVQAPEPSSAALALIGVALLGLMMRRRLT
jgi:MYXO-CTERM domain-containing protein